MHAERLWCSKTHLCPCDITEETAETGNFVNEHTCMIALCAAGCRTFVFCLLIADPRQQSFLFYLGYVCTTGMNSMSRSVHSRTPSRGHLSKDGRRRAAAVWRSQRKREIQVATPPPSPITMPSYRSGLSRFSVCFVRSDLSAFLAARRRDNRLNPERGQSE